ncbi:BadF/BadG/BcrA/BcrD ATPase family protein [Petrotoga halophila]|uniref:BadF/BadG/BcrA/BcrD ATPase family protein n=1 Tax=Petrotoga halophila TaxID=301141 RepID=UPI000CDEC123|nr:BadF/BadG/BcrA/BcrD ATPase family protein [Petrotoga halophila]
MKFLGIDGGGTHIAGSLINESGDVLKKIVIETGVNLTSVDQERLKSIISKIKTKATEVDGIVISFSGAGTPQRKKQLLDIFKEIFVINNIVVYNDGESILYSLFKGSSIAIVIAGTGTLIIGMDKDQNIVRSGGWGHLFDDVGGGFWITTRIIQEAFRYRDKLREFDPIFNRLLKFYSCGNIEELTSLQGRKDFKTIISSFTKKALEKPTNLVEEIINEGISDLTLRCKKILDSLNINYLYLSGSIFKSEYYLQRFQEFMYQYSLNPLNFDVSEQMALLARKYFLTE